ncbi:hypothetical protein R3P38DRAFT_3291001 [Favolaschia claudopus]|uniref:Uncharacterized protein n=1 Tax=Favolaschia claudopus TaxID=2862362 RepID=A0AAV9ZQ34_9AGAR
MADRRKKVPATARSTRASAGTIKIPAATAPSLTDTDTDTKVSTSAVEEPEKNGHDTTSMVTDDAGEDFVMVTNTTDDDFVPTKRSRKTVPARSPLPSRVKRNNNPAGPPEAGGRSPDMEMTGRRQRRRWISESGRRCRTLSPRRHQRSSPNGLFTRVTFPRPSITSHQLFLPLAAWTAPRVLGPALAYNSQSGFVFVCLNTFSLLGPYRAVNRSYYLPINAESPLPSHQCLLFWKPGFN